MERVFRALIELLRSEISPGSEQFSVTSTLNETEWQNLYKLADYNAVTHLAGDAVVSHDLLDAAHPLYPIWENAPKEASFRNAQRDYELGRVKHAFEEKGIPFLPLKGALVQAFYPAPWMRTSCDIDVLVHPDRLKDAARELERLGYVFRNKTSHDWSFRADSGVLLELHFSLTYDKTLTGVNRVLRQVETYIHPLREGGMERRLEDGFFLFYLYAHAVHHVNDGGCGVRPVMDVFLLKQKMESAAADLAVLLEEAGLTDFARGFDLLGNVWFGDAAPTPLTCQMEDFILSGGQFGNHRNKMTVQPDSSFHVSLWKRIWQPYDELCINYPSLTGHRWLQPAYEFRRWTHLLDKETRRVKREQWKSQQNITKEEISKTEDMLSQLGLK